MNYVDFVFFFFLFIYGYKTPVFQKNFGFSLIEGLTKISVAVWNSNTKDNFIGSGK